MPVIPTPPLLRISCSPALTDARREWLSKADGVQLTWVEQDLGHSTSGDKDVVPAPLSDLTLLTLDRLDDPATLRLLALDVAVVLHAEAAVPAPIWQQALALGVQDLLGPADWNELVALRLLAAAFRHRLARQARMAYATDLATGLPHQQQLLEHMSHLLALREREPAPMALLVLRIEGLATTQAGLGVEAASALRRKLAVRLRSGLRASDVVASIGGDSFAVLLAWIDAAADVDGVAAKLVQSVQRPFNLAGQSVALAVSVGVGRYPEDGKDSVVLLQRAEAQAAGAAGQGRSGHANFAERGAGSAANDDAG